MSKRSTPLSRNWVRIVSFLSVLAVASALGTTHSMAAADPAEMMIRSGVELRRQGRDQEALPKFQSAYEISRSSRAAAQLGLCEQTLQMWEQAEQHLSEALLGQSDPWVARNRKVLQDARDRCRQQLATVEFKVEPPEALISINDVAIGKASEADKVWVKDGDLSITVSSPGYLSQTLNLKAKAGETTAVKMLLAKAAIPARLAEDKNTSTNAEVVSNQAVMPSAPNDASQPPQSNWRPYEGWGAVGLGAVALGVGVLGYFAHETAVKNFNELQDDNGGKCGKQGGTIVGPDGCRAFDHDVGQAKTQIAVGLVGAAVFGGLGAWLLTSGKPASPMESTSSLKSGLCRIDGPVSAGAGFSFVCRGSF